MMPHRVFQWVACPHCDKYTRLEFLDGEPEDENAPYCGEQCKADANPEE